MLREGIDYLLYRSAVRIDQSVADQHKGNLFVSKNYIMLNVCHNMDLMETTFGESGHEQEYEDDHTLNPIHNLKASSHNVGVAGKEVKQSFEENKKFRELEKLVKLNYTTLCEKAQQADSIETLEEQVRQTCLQNQMSLIIRVDQIHEMTTSFFKLWYNGFKLLMRDGMQFKVITPRKGSVRKFIGK
jgi:hypothetical protein